MKAAKTAAAIVMLAAIMAFVAVPAAAQENYFGQTKVNLHNGYYFLIPDHYVAINTVFPLMDGIEPITKAYSNKLTAANALFMSFKLPETDQTLKEMGIENFIADKMKQTINVKIARAIEMNGRDTFFLRGETKDTYTLETSRFGGPSSRSTSRTQVKMEVVMYIIKEGDYVYYSMFQTPVQYFGTNFRTFMEIQNSFSNKPL